MRETSEPRILNSTLRFPEVVGLSDSDIADPQFQYPTSDEGVRLAHANNILGEWGVGRILEAIRGGKSLNESETQFVRDHFATWELGDFEKLQRLYRSESTV
ncbi:MAG: hypothetical protein WCW16_03310 [Candidatus Magasanikbacteria bacterium]